MKTKAVENNCNNSKKTANVSAVTVNTAPGYQLTQLIWFVLAKRLSKSMRSGVDVCV